MPRVFSWRRPQGIRDWNRIERILSEIEGARKKRLLKPDVQAFDNHPQAGKYAMMVLLVSDQGSS